MKKLYLQIILGLILLGLGAGLWAFRLHNETVTATPNVSSSIGKASAPVQATITGNPTQLDIPSLNMSLPVINGYYSSATKQWTLTLNKVQYATITPPPNNAGGDTFLYGHYRSEVFARLHLIHLGAQAIVTTDNNHHFTYALDHVVVTSPNDDSVFSYQGPPILTIQTCTGILFQYRQLFTFKFVGVS